MKDKTLYVRLPARLHEKVAKAAAADRRSMSDWVCCLLEDSLELEPKEKDRGA